LRDSLGFLSPGVQPFGGLSRLGSVLQLFFALPQRRFGAFGLFHLFEERRFKLLQVGGLGSEPAFEVFRNISQCLLGLPPTEPSLGMLIANGFQYMMSGRYWISIYPGIALIVLIVAINLVGDQVRDQLNPRLKR